MNWTIIIAGNILMDSAIALFAILSTFETKIIRHADGKKIKSLLKSDLNKNEIRRLRKVAEFFSPITGKLSILIVSLFIIGLILQITGLFY